MYVSATTIGSLFSRVVKFYGFVQMVRKGNEEGCDSAMILGELEWNEMTMILNSVNGEQNEDVTVYEKRTRR